MNKKLLPYANIINILGIASVPYEERVEIVAKATELIDTRVRARVLERLNAQAQEEFAALLEQENEDQLIEFFVKHGIDMPALIEEETNRLKEELAELARE